MSISTCSASIALDGIHRTCWAPPLPETDIRRSFPEVRSVLQQCRTLTVTLQSPIRSGSPRHVMGLQRNTAKAKASLKIPPLFTESNQNIVKTPPPHPLLSHPMISQLAKHCVLVDSNLFREHHLTTTRCQDIHVSCLNPVLDSSSLFPVLLSSQPHGLSFLSRIFSAHAVRNCGMLPETFPFAQNGVQHVNRLAHLHQEERSAPQDQIRQTTRYVSGTSENIEIHGVDVHKIVWTSSPNKSSRRVDS